MTIDGEWLPPIPEAHKCKLPVHAGHFPGERWRCRCGKVFVLEQHSDQRDGTSWNSFRAAKGKELET